MIEIQIEGLENLYKVCVKLERLDQCGESILAGAGESIRDCVVESFKKQSSPFGEKWKALKPSTIAQKKKAGKNNGILIREGDLSDELRWTIESSKNQVYVSNNVQSKKGFKYGVVHQWGNKKRNIPARPFLPVKSNGALQKDVLRTIKKDTEDFIKSIIQKNQQV